MRKDWLAAELTTNGRDRYQVLPASRWNQLDRRPPYRGALPTVISPRMIKYTVMMPAQKNPYNSSSLINLCFH